jgi:23S rRNA (adenine1618-N6)-methyltransferase
VDLLLLVHLLRLRPLLLLNPLLLHHHSLSGDHPVRGLDIGCGANFIYCLLGAAMYGWGMSGSDISDVAQQWAQRNIQDNPQLTGLLGVRQVEGQVG